MKRRCVDLKERNMDSLKRRVCTLGIDLSGAHCLVIGGGTLGLRKSRTLYEAGAVVVLAAPVLSDECRAWTESHSIRWITTRYRENLLRDLFLVVAATNDKDLNDRIAHDAAAHRILCSNTSSAETSQVIFPALWTEEKFTMAIHTHGNDCRLAKRIRDAIKDSFHHASCDGFWE